MNPELVSRILSLGFKITDDVKSLIHAYQVFHGLLNTGELDSQTIRSIEDCHRFCGHPDIMPEQATIGGICKWNNKSVTWTIVQGLPNIPNDVLKQAYDLAWSFWVDVSGLQPVFITDPNQAMIQMGSRNIDSAGGVLGESELPCGNTRVCRQWYDTQERWIISETPSQGQIDLVRVVCHELGHALGISHINAGNLMAPVYSPTIRRPQVGDIREIQSRYGEPSKVPVPDSDITIHIKGKDISIPGYRVTRLN